MRVQYAAQLLLQALRQFTLRHAQLHHRLQRLYLLHGLFQRQPVGA